MNIKDVELRWLGHSGFLIKNSAPKGVPFSGGKTIYIDPYNIKETSEKADIILLTHSHYDHCSVADIEKVIQKGTKIIAPADCQSKITRFDVPIEMHVVEAGQEVNFGNIKISTLPAYNTDKHFHPKDEGWVGYLIKISGVVIYHAGDTDIIPEMQKLTGHNKSGKEFVALLPIGGRFTMSVEEAVEAAKIIKPTLAVPMHYASIIGSKADAKEFVELCKEEGINAQIIEKS